MSRTRRVVVVGGSIAGLTTAQVLRAEGFEGSVTLVSDELHPPYSRVPLSKGILAGRDPLERAYLPTPADVNLLRGVRATRLDLAGRLVHTDSTETLPYDDVVIATGARARRLAPLGQRGELVLRDLGDVERLNRRLVAASSVLVVGAGFLGMEIASTCVSLGLKVTVVDRVLPLSAHLGDWLSTTLTGLASDYGITFVLAPDGVRLVGAREVSGVMVGDRLLEADVVVTAAGDLPNSEWLTDSGLRLFRGGVLVDDNGCAAPHVLAAGDVAARSGLDGQWQRTPHWTNAVDQGRAAAGTIVHPGSVSRPPEPYFWSELAGLDVRISGNLPVVGAPELLEGDVAASSALLRWRGPQGPTVVALGYKMPVVALKRLGARAAPTVGRTSSEA